MIVVIDNYDSFVHNLARLLRLAGAETEVVRNDAIDAQRLRGMGAEAVVLSPGPGQPSQAGCSVAIVREMAGELPILGVCLGHQAIVEAFGGRVTRAPEPMHGRTSVVRHSGEGLFQGLPQPMEVCRYHSLAADEAGLPAELRAAAWAEDRTVMAIEHTGLPIFGVQFHPEALLTQAGGRLIENFFRLAGLNRAEVRA